MLFVYVYRATASKISFMTEMNQKLLIFIRNRLKLVKQATMYILSPSKVQQPLAIIIIPWYVNFIDLWGDCMHGLALGLLDQWYWKSQQCLQWGNWPNGIIRTLGVSMHAWFEYQNVLLGSFLEGA